MKVRYDPEADILYIEFMDSVEIVDSEFPADGVVVGIGRNGEIVDMEIWDASRRIFPAIIKHLEQTKLETRARKGI